MTNKYQLRRPDGFVISSTDEQEKIIDFAKSSRQNMIINALAGAAKTSTLEFICQQVTGIPILSLAFNKRIADEMTKRLPGHVKCQTLNSLGHRVWANATGKRLVLSNDKVYGLVKLFSNRLDRADQKEFFESFSDVTQAVAFAKVHGYIPETVKFGTGLINREEFLATAFDIRPTSLVIEAVDWCLKESIREAYEGVVDFADQLYMPTLFGGTFPKFPLVLVDEAQDLSPLNHAMLAKLCTTSRLIAVGDPYQSIYGFRGAVSSGMTVLKETFEAEEFTLSVSFRCPIAIVKRARFRAPHMKWWGEAQEGEVNVLETWNANTIPDGAAVICRCNGPLFTLAFRLIRAGRGVHLVGADIGPGLVKQLKKLGPESMTQAQLFDAIDSWETEMLKKSTRKGSVIEKAQCLRIFAEQGPNLGAAVAYAEMLFSVKGPIQLLSGHKSKGLEWPHVFHLDPQLIPFPYVEHSQASMEQELNVRYVIETRPKEKLTLISSAGWPKEE